MWLADGRTILGVDSWSNEIFVLDRVTRERRSILGPLPNSAYGIGEISPDRRVLYFLRTTNEGDIWSLHMD